MGRPLNKRFFGSGEGDQLAIRAKIGSAAEGDGFIVKQTGSSRYIATVGADTGVVTLVDKDNGTLLAGEATITFVDESDDDKRVKKALRHRVVFFDGTGAQWSFDAAEGDIWQAIDVDFEEPVVPVITIDTQPADFVGDDGDPVSFTVDASVDPVQALTYQWQFNDNGGAFGNLSDGGGVTGATTDTVSLGAGAASLNTNTYRVIVSSAGAEDVISDAATVTIAPA